MRDEDSDGRLHSWTKRVCQFTGANHIRRVMNIVVKTRLKGTFFSIIIACQRRLFYSPLAAAQMLFCIRQSTSESLATTQPGYTMALNNGNKAEKSLVIVDHSHRWSSKSSSSFPPIGAYHC